jgi:hypothetical protein
MFTCVASEHVSEHLIHIICDPCCSLLAYLGTISSELTGAAETVGSSLGDVILVSHKNSVFHFDQLRIG